MCVRSRGRMLYKMCHKMAEPVFHNTVYVLNRSKYKWILKPTPGHSSSDTQTAVFNNFQSSGGHYSECGIVFLLRRISG